MLNPYQRSHLKFVKPQEFKKEKISPEDKPSIVACFENVVGDQYRKTSRAVMALCPFHGENTPSFAMYEETNTYYCFSCGATGDSYKFLMEQLELDFPGAKEYAERNNLYDNT